MCIKCQLLIELYGMTDQSGRAYFLMTELFVQLHGSDTCTEQPEQAENNDG